MTKVLKIWDRDVTDLSNEDLELALKQHEESVRGLEEMQKDRPEEWGELRERLEPNSTPEIVLQEARDDVQGILFEQQRREYEKSEMPKIWDKEVAELTDLDLEIALKQSGPEAKYYDSTEYDSRGWQDLMERHSHDGINLKAEFERARAEVRVIKYEQQRREYEKGDESNEPKQVAPRLPMK